MQNRRQGKGRTGFRTAGRLIVMSSVIFVWWSATLTAQINISETDLHDGEIVYGLKAPGAPIPYVNLDAITFSAWGSDAPSYTDVSFYAYGLYADVDLANSGIIDVNAVGGLSITAGVAIADANTYAVGLYAPLDDVSNTGAVTVSVTGGTAAAGSGTVQAQAYGVAHGLRSFYDIDNGAAVTVNVEGGNATVNGNVGDYGGNKAYAEATAWGLRGSGSAANRATVTNSGNVNVTATGGTADANNPVAYTSAKATTYGFFGTNSTVDNCGAITVAAQGGTLLNQGTQLNGAENSAEAKGLWLGTSSLTNRGTLMVTANGGTGGQNTNGIGQGILADEATIDNSGAINVTSNGGTARFLDERIYADALSAGSATGIMGQELHVGNTGAITSMATGGTADGGNVGWAKGVATAHGIFVYSIDIDPTDDIEPDHSNYVDNSGTITATALGGTADANDNDALANGSASGIGVCYGDLVNEGAVHATAFGGDATINGTGTAQAHGEVHGLHVLSGSLDNNGLIDANAVGGTAMALDGIADANASATARADGVYASGYLQNSGVVNVNAVGGTASAPAGNADADADACGLGSETGDVINTGAVTVSATGGAATGDTPNASAHAYGIDANANVNNAGDLTVTAMAQEGFSASACGIHMDGTGTLTNTGIIRASADQAYELCIASGTTTLVDTYNVTLDGEPSDASIYVGDGATLALNGSTLTVASVSGETLWGTEYRLFETEGTGVVGGNFGNVRALNPNIAAHYYDQNNVDSADDTVALGYSPAASPTLDSAGVEKEAVSQAIDVVNGHVTSTLLQSILFPATSPPLANAGPTAESVALARRASSTESNVYVEPYYSRVDRDANPMGFDGRLWGFVAGYERQIDNSLIGLHLGYGRSDIDYTGAGYNANSEDQDIVTGGFNGLTRWNEWTLRYGLTGFYGSHDYKGLTGLSLTETEEGETDSYGTVATLMAGHIIQRGAHVFLPEAGLNWLWAHRQRYTTETSDPSWNTTYSAMNDHDLQAEAALHWLSGFMYGDIHVAPSASIGVRHLLTDAESTVSQTVPGAAPVSVTSERDRTAMTLSGSVMLTKARHAVSLAYDGEYSPDTKRHSLWLRYGWEF